MKEISWEEVERKEAWLWWQKSGLSYTATGYGKKIPTVSMIKLPFGRKIWRRVYCCIFSNSGSCYVVYNGKPLWIR